MTEVIERRGSPPAVISVDNGSEFTSRALDHWAYWNHVKLDFSRPGKPTDNAHIEAFNSILRRECLSQHWFIDLSDAERTLTGWLDDYNNFRPHGSLGGSTPADFAAGALDSLGPDELENLQNLWLKEGVKSIAVFEFIESWYNPRRRHSALGYLSPIVFERRREGVA